MRSGVRASMPHALQWLMHVSAPTLKSKACHHLIQISETHLSRIHICHSMCAYPSDVAVYSAQTGIDLPKLYLSQRPPKGVP